MVVKTHSSEFADQFARLRYKKERRWASLPGWARFFWGLGASIARFDEEKRRYVVALALPTRSYAAAFIGSGLAYANIFLHPDIDKQHLEFILSLPEETPVRYLDKGKIKKAIKKDVVTHEQKLLIGILIEAEGNKTIYVASEDANRIEVSDKKYDRLPTHQKGHNIRPPSELLNELLPGKDYEYIFQTRIDGIIVGSFSALRQEAQTPLAVVTRDGQEYQGTLNELFRIKGLNPASSGYRFLLQPSTSSEVLTLPSELSPHSTVIFDGALSFSKWKEYYRENNWIVVLDHTESNFQNAVSQINQEYVDRSDSGLRISPPPLPSGIELMIFARDI